MRRLSLLLGLLAIAAVALVLAQAIVRAQTGPLPLVGVFEIHLLGFAGAAAVLGIPGALGGGRGRAWLRLALVGVVVLAVVRLGDELWSPVSDDPGVDGRLTVLSWNLEYESKPGSTVVDGIMDTGADVVALQELTYAFAEAIEADAALRAAYPYRILVPRGSSEGLGILSRRPLLVREDVDPGRVLAAGLLLEDGRVAEVLVVHLSRPPFGTSLGVPTSLDTRRRDLELVRLGELVAGLEDPGAALVVGDLNGSPTEPGMAALDGLADAHRVAGGGPGFTWRPGPLLGTELALLRIDVVRTGAWLAPVASEVDCSLPGDHCRLLVTLGVVGAGG